ncbi:ABC transporter substrate-binding protein [Janthinobacterium sp. BJB412]|nr:ABC transporter substrate-binding protein [Janthinobacterium sp. BJB412]
MSLRSLLLLWLALPVLAAAAPLPAIARLASDDWCPFICASHGQISGGYLVDLTTQALALSGVRVESLLLPLSRAVSETASGAIEGVYAPSSDPRLQLSVPLAHSRACFYTLAGAAWRYRGTESLGALRVGVIADYGYDDGEMDAYVARHRDDRASLAFAFGDAAGLTNLHKLLRGRFPVWLEHEAVANQLVAKLGAASRIRQAGCLAQALPLTIGFSIHDARAARWLHALADGLRSMAASGQLAALRARYHLAPDEAGAPAASLR